MKKIVAVVLLLASLPGCFTIVSRRQEGWDRAADYLKTSLNQFQRDEEVFMNSLTQCQRELFWRFQSNPNIKDTCKPPLTEVQWNWIANLLQRKAVLDVQALTLFEEYDRIQREDREDEEKRREALAAWARELGSRASRVSTQNGQTVYSEDECIGPVIMGQCHGSILPKSDYHPTCYGTMLNGQCTGPMF